MINPLESARKRKEEIHNKKTDKLDPISISKVYYDKEEMMELKRRMKHITGSGKRIDCMKIS